MMLSAATSANVGFLQVVQLQAPSTNLATRLAERILFGRPFLIRFGFAICYRSVVDLPVCLSCMSVTLAHCGQTVGWIKTKLVMQVGLGPGHIVLDGDPPPSPKGHSPHTIFGPYLLRQNGCMDQDATWYGGRPRPRRRFVRWGPRSSSPRRGRSLPQIFVPCLLWSNGWMDQDGTWHGGRPQPRRLCVRWGPAPRPFPNKGAEHPPQFSAHLYCGKTARCIKMPPGMEVGLSPGDFLLDGDPAPSPKRGRSPLPNFRPISIVAKQLDASRCHWHLLWR